MYMVVKLHYRANLHSSFRPIAHFFYDRAMSPIIEKLRSDSVVMHVFGVPHTTCEPEINYMALGRESTDQAG